MVLQKMPWKERVGLAKRMKGVFLKGIKATLVIENRKLRENIYLLFVVVFSTDLMSTSSGSLLTGNNMVGKDYFTKIDCISEVSRAINNWFLSFQGQNKLKFKNWA